MPSLGNLFVEIGAKTGGLDGGVDSSDSKLKKLSSTMRKTVKASAALGAAAGIAGAAIIAKLVNSGRIAIDNQAKLAQSLDGTIAGLRGLTMAGADAGIEAGSLSQSILKLNSRLGEAQKGSGAAYDSLNRLGLSAENLSALDVDDRVATIADRIKELGLTSAQTQFELRELGIRNEKMSILMRQGGAAIREQAQEVRNLGLNLSMVDAAQVEIANDSLEVFGHVLTGIKDQLSVTSAPYITALSEGFRETAIENEGFKSQIEATINTIIKGFGKAGDAVRGLRVVFAGLKLVVGGFVAAAITAFEMVAEAWAIQASVITSGVNKVIDGLNAIGAEIQKIPDPSESQFMNGLRVLGDEARNRVVELKDEMSSLANQELPSSKIDKFLSDVAEKSKETAKKVVAARAEILGADSSYDPAGAENSDSSQSAQEKLNSELAAIKNRYLTEEELNRQHQEMMAVIGEEYNAANFETEAQWRSVKEQAEADHMSNLYNIQASGYQGMQSLISAHWGKAGAETAGAMKSILGTMATGSRKAFEVSKAWAMADALVSTYQGIAAGVKLGWPQGIPAVAWASATGFAQVSQIKNQQFGGAGGAAASGGGAPGQAPNPVGVGGSTQQGGGTYRVEGVSLGGFVRADDIAETLKQMQKDGAFRGNVQFTA